MKVIKSPAFLFYAGDYLKDTQLLPVKAEIAYIRILCEHINNLTVKHHAIKFITRELDDEERILLFDRLEQLEDGYRIPWVVTAIEKQRAFSESRRNNANAKKGSTSLPSVKHKHHHKEKENENENDNNKALENEKAYTAELWPSFEDFWTKYEKKIDRKKCFSKWQKLNHKTKIKIMEHLEEYLPATNRNGDTQYRRYPLTYLNSETWNNEIPKTNENYNDTNATYERTARELGLISN